MREFDLVSNICVGCLHKWCSIIIGMESEQPVEKGIQGEQQIMILLDDIMENEEGLNQDIYDVLVSEPQT